MLHTLSDELLLSQVKALAGEERRIHREVLETLLEVDRRQLHLARGFSSLFVFCTDELGYSPASAQRRIASMRLLKEMSQPEREKVQAKIESGTLTLNHLAQVQSVARAEHWSLEAKREVLQSVEGKSVRQCEKIIASQMTSPALPRETIRPVSATQSQVTLVLDEEALQLLERFKELTAHRNPLATNAGAIRLALQIAVERMNPEREVRGKGSTKSEGTAKPQQSAKPESDTGASQSVPTPKAAAGHRHPSRPLRRSIWRRDRGCQYVDPITGRHCNSRFKLELDHHVPFSKGGKTTSENLRLLCRAHNAYFGGRIKPGRASIAKM
jgi:5-methylcytosine-specific restriction endonuclease McrA